MMYYSISELAEQLQISPRTIRYYEEKKLISPTRSSGNQRMYTRKDRARLKLILRGKYFGLSLDEIASVIGMADVDVSEVDQIRKSLNYGKQKLIEIQKRKQELSLLENEIIEMRKKLQSRLNEIEKPKQNPQV